MIAHAIGEFVWTAGTLALALWVGIRISDRMQRKADAVGISRLEAALPIAVGAAIVVAGIIIGGRYII